MIHNKVDTLITSLTEFLTGLGFKRDGQSFSFIKKYSNDYQREEILSITATENNKDNTIDIGCNISIRYPQVNALYQQISTHLLTESPLFVNKSISYFTPRNEPLSIRYQPGINDDAASLELKGEIIEGIFSLLHYFPDLEAIYREAESRNPLLKDQLWHSQMTKEHELLLLCMLYTLKGINGMFDVLVKSMDEQAMAQMLLQHYYQNKR